MVILKEELYTWMKNLAIFYLFFSVFLQLVPDQAYERYIRFFMGIILILMFCAPILTLLGKEDAFLESFSGFYAGEKRLLEEKALQDIGEQYLKRSYEEEIQRRITAAFLEKGLFPLKIEVQMTGEKLSVFLLFRAEDMEREEEIQDELERKCGITPDTGEVQIMFDEFETMDGTFSDWNSSGDSLSSNLKGAEDGGQSTDFSE